MKRALILTVLAACSTPDSDPSGECGANHPCATGYECEPVTHSCIRAGDGDGEPDTLLAEQPAPLMSAARATVSFSSPAAGATFECSLDAGAFAACASPLVLADLADGAHELAVRAVRGQRRDATPATARWTVDTTAPETTITAGPRGDVAESAAAWSFTCDTPPCSFECRLDAEPFASCAPGDARALAPGAHTFAVRARDSAGNTDATPAEAKVTVRGAARSVVIRSGPRDPTNETTATFTFVCLEDGKEVGCEGTRCALDDGPAAACASPASRDGLAEGRHRFTAGGAEHVWTIDLTPPAVTIVRGPQHDAVVGGGAVAFGYEASEKVSGFACALDGGAFASCDAAGRSYTGLASGPHVFAVRATDLAGNTGEAATATFRVDDGAPVVKILSPLPDEVLCDAPRVAYATVPADEGVTWSCVVDGGAAGPCPGFDRLAGGRHTLTVRATDDAGNRGEASVAFTIDAEGPVAELTVPPIGCAGGSIAVAPRDATVASCTVTRDGGEPVACTVDDKGGLGYHVERGGGYTVSVVLKDACGNAGSPATRRFDVDATAPVVKVSAASVCPAGAIRWSAADDAGPSIGGALTLTAASVDGTSCASDGKLCRRSGDELTFAGLDEGANPHRLEVRVADACGNVGTGTASLDVDSTGPTLSRVEGGGGLNSGAARLVFGAPEDAASVTAGLALGGAGELASCECDLSSCACTGLAAGTNRIVLRARDACGNSGAPVTRDVSAGFGPYDGHAVLIGHDYSSDETPGRLVGNAATLTPFVHHQLAIGRDEVRVLAYRPDGVDAAVATRVTGAVRAATRAVFQDFSDPALLVDMLPGRDVLLIYDPPESLTDDALFATGERWAGTLLAFVERGGVVVGLGRRSWMMMTGGNIGLIATGGWTSNKLPFPTGPVAFESYPAGVTGAKPFRVARDVGNFYAAPSGSFCQPVTDLLAATLYELQTPICGGEGCSAHRCPLVVDKLFPEYRIDVSVTPDESSEMPTCVPSIVGIGKKGGNFAVAGGDPAGSFACAWGGQGSAGVWGQCAVTSEGGFSLTTTEEQVPVVLPAHLDVLLLDDGEPARVGKGSFIVDHDIFVSGNPTTTNESCTAWFVVFEYQPPVSDQICEASLGDSYEPFSTVTCMLERQADDGSWVTVASKTDEACGAVADDRGGFVSDRDGMLVDWTKEIREHAVVGQVRMRVTAEDFHGNVEATKTSWTIFDAGVCR